MEEMEKTHKEESSLALLCKILVMRDTHMASPKGWESGSESRVSAPGSRVLWHTDLKGV